MSNETDTIPATPPGYIQDDLRPLECGMRVESIFRVLIEILKQDDPDISLGRTTAKMYALDDIELYLDYGLYHPNRVKIYRLLAATMLMRSRLRAQ